MEHKTIKTDDLINDTVWSEMITKYGGDGNPRLSTCPFYQKKRKIYSQSGEEGILEAIFDKIGLPEVPTCVEYGAANGVLISNTYYFHVKYGMKRLLLEGSQDWIDKKQTDEPIKQALVSASNINELLEELPDNFDLLSSDIDGDDYYVLKAMTKTPRVIVLEYHVGIPNDLPIVIEEGKGDVRSNETVLTGWTEENPLNGYYGANLLAFYRLLSDKGYEFVTTLSDNAFFVHRSEFDKLGIEHIPEDICIENYFSPAEYWGKTHRDRYNHDWIIME